MGHNVAWGRAHLRSIDVTAIGCASVSDAQTISSLILRYAKHTSQARYQNKTLVSTFAGDNCAFGQGSTAAGWNYVRSLVRAGGREMYLIPAIFVDTNQFSSMTWFDGAFNWDSAWPVGSAGSAPLTTASDETWISRLGSRGYMASVSPLFFTYYGPQSWNKDWIYVSRLVVVCQTVIAETSDRTTG
jgi:glucan endo-1,3-alpha-glucosidase